MACRHSIDSAHDAGNDTVDESKSPAQPKKSVSWATYSGVRIYPKPTPQDCLNSWYARSDYKGFRKHNRIMAKLSDRVSEKQLVKDFNESSFGLEYVSTEQTNKLEERKFAAWDAVLYGQEKQHSIEEIAYAYRKITHASQLEANRLAVSFIMRGAIEGANAQLRGQSWRLQQTDRQKVATMA